MTVHRCPIKFAICHIKIAISSHLTHLTGISSTHNLDKNNTPENSWWILGKSWKTSMFITCPSRKVHASETHRPSSVMWSKALQWQRLHEGAKPSPVVGKWQEIHDSPWCFSCKSCKPKFLLPAHHHCFPNEDHGFPSDVPSKFWADGCRKAVLHTYCWPSFQ